MFWLRYVSPLRVCLDALTFNPLQIEQAFEPGYDPALELAKSHTKRNEEPAYDADEPWTEYLRRKEQDQIDDIVKGNEPGHYFLLLGPKVRSQVPFVSGGGFDEGWLPGLRQGYHDFRSHERDPSRRSLYVRRPSRP
jgi:hypothetical protein